MRENLAELACRPGAPFLTEGRLVLATEGEAGELSQQVLYAMRGTAEELGDIVEPLPEEEWEGAVPSSV